MRQVKENIFSVGAIDYDARLFDRLIPLPDGTSYNSYLIKGSEKTALLDTVEPAKAADLFDNLAKANVTKIDYIIAHHAEQDHSGSLPAVLERYPNAKIVTNPKCKNFLIDLLELKDDQFITVDDGQTLSLGDKTLQFIYLPWVHWPETMGAYLQEDKILFSCDFFGSHFATSKLFADDPASLYEPAKRYYAEIMMPFRRQINANITKLESIDIQMIAPSHGPIYDKPEYIVNCYKDWASDEVKNEVVVPYVSMHGSTARMVRHFVGALIDRGIDVKQFELSTVDVGKLAISLVDAATIVIGSPTILIGAHPSAAYAAFLVNALKPKTKYVSIIGSFGWGSKMIDQLASSLPLLKAEMLPNVVAKGFPKEEDFKQLDRLADDILLKHKELGLV